MNIKRVKQEIKDTIEVYLTKDEYGSYVIPSIRQRPLLMIGPPGVGKTQIMEQISQECQIGLVAYTITHHTRQSAIGLPVIEHKMYSGKEYMVTEYTMSEIIGSVYDKIEQTGIMEGILFIDEINCVSETLAPTMLQFLQGKRFGNHKLPDGWMIVAAGNPPEYNKSVREFDIVTLDRIRRIEIEPDYEAWKEYADQVNIHPAIRSYLQIRREYFCRIETTVDGKLFATPRGWEDLSELVGAYERLEKTVDRDVIGEYIQFPKIAKDFANYLELYHKYEKDYQIEEIFEGKQMPESIFDKLQKAAFDERVSVVGLLLSGLNKRFQNVINMGEMMELRMLKLRELQKSGGFAGTATQALEAYSAMIIQFQAEWEQKRSNGLLSRSQERMARQLTVRLENDFSMLRRFDLADGAEVWEHQRELFCVDSDAYEQAVDSTGKSLESVFDFMEGAFAGGQEMVLFVTELNTGFFSVKFLQEYECIRYYEYNKNLLFYQEEDELRDIIRKRQP